RDRLCPESDPRNVRTLYERARRSGKARCDAIPHSLQLCSSNEQFVRDRKFARSIYQPAPDAGHDQQTVCAIPANHPTRCSSSRRPLLHAGESYDRDAHQQGRSELAMRKIVIGILLSSSFLLGASSKIANVLLPGTSPLVTFRIVFI